MLAFPCAWRARVAGLITGLIGVGVLNLLRIAVLGLIVGYRYDWFDTVHALLMQGFLIVFVAPLWIAWMFWVLKTEARPRHAVSAGQSADS